MELAAQLPPDFKEAQINYMKQHIENFYDRDGEPPLDLETIASNSDKRPAPRNPPLQLLRESMKKGD